MGVGGRVGWGYSLCCRGIMWPDKDQLAYRLSQEGAVTSLGLALDNQDNIDRVVNLI